MEGFYVNELKRIKEIFLNKELDKFNLVLAKDLSYDFKNQCTTLNKTVFSKVSDLSVIDIFIEAAENKTPLDEFEIKVNKLFNLKPFECFLMNKKYMQINTLAFVCDKNCMSCLDFITCKMQKEGRVNLIINIQQVYMTMIKENEFNNQFGRDKNSKVRRKSNPLMELLFSKIYYLATETSNIDMN